MTKQYVERERTRISAIIKERSNPLGFICFADLPDWESPKDGDCFGPWRFQQSNLTLQLEGEYAHHHREIDLEDLRSSTKLLDALHHSLEKVWGNPEVIGNLLLALFHLTGCWWGDPKLNLTEAIQKQYGAKK